MVLVKKRYILLILSIIVLTFSFGISRICISTSSKDSFVEESTKEETKIVSVKKKEKVKDKEKEASLEVPVEEELAISKEEVAIKETKEITIKKEETKIKQTSSVSIEAPSIQDKSSVLETSVAPQVVDPVETIRQNGESLGTLGRLFLPSVDFSVAVYSTSLSDGDHAQKIVDDRDSAAYFQIRNQSVIADHNHQGFHRIIDIVVGEKAYIKNSDGQIQVYKMTNKLEGMNLGYDLTDLNEKSVLDGESDLILYTCYKISEYDNHVMITFWELEH